MSYKELEQKAEQALEKRLGTYGYMSYQDCHKHYKDGFIDGYMNIYNEYRLQRFKTEKANKIIITFLSMLENRTNLDEGLLKVFAESKSYIEEYGES